MSKKPVWRVCDVDKDYPIEDLDNMINVSSERVDKGVTMSVVKIYSKHPRRGKVVFIIYYFEIYSIAKSPTHCLSIDLPKNRRLVCINQKVDFVIWSKENFVKGVTANGHISISQFSIN